MNTDAKLAPIRESIAIDASIDTVWRIMTSPETVPRWLGCLNYDGKVGSTFYMQQDQTKARAGDITGATHCEILAMEAPNLLRFSWFVPGFPPTFISMRLDSVSPKQTSVAFTHEGWDQFPPDMVRQIYDALSGGWKSFVLPNLKREAEAA